MKKEASSPMLLRQCLLISISFLFLSSSCSEASEDKITIATAASMQYAIKELTTDFARRSGIQCEVVIGSSGKLTAQIMQGAPFDIFLSADMKYPDYIAQNNLALEDPEIYAIGKLVIWTTQDSIEPLLSVMAHPDIEKIAIANPKTAPYGEAAIELLKRNDLLDSVGYKLVYAESIAQANQFISTKAVSLGFTSYSSVLAEPLKDMGKWILTDESQYQPLLHGAVLLRRDKEQNLAASEFYSYLFTEEAGEILEEFGYSRDE